MARTDILVAVPSSTIRLSEKNQWIIGVLEELMYANQKSLIIDASKLYSSNQEALTGVQSLIKANDFPYCASKCKGKILVSKNLNDKEITKCDL